jgi:hypothetical protein
MLNFSIVVARGRPSATHAARSFQETHRVFELTRRHPDLDRQDRHGFAGVCTNGLMKALGELGKVR